MMKFLASLFLALALVGCSTTNPNTGKPEFDPVKTEQVRAVIEPLAASAVRRVVVKNPDVAPYFTTVGSIFCTMAETGNFSPETLVNSINGISSPKNADVADVVNLMVALYKIQFSKRFEAELPPDKWPAQVSILFCDSIDRGLRDAGFPPIKP